MLSTTKSKPMEDDTEWSLLSLRLEMKDIEHTIYMKKFVVEMNFSEFWWLDVFGCTHSIIQSNIIIFLKYVNIRRELIVWKCMAVKLKVITQVLT